MAQRLTDQDVKSPAGRAFHEAIESSIDGNPKYPSGAVFIDGDDPGVGKAIRRAVDDGAPVVLAYKDGSTRVLYPGQAVTAA